MQIQISPNSLQGLPALQQLSYLLPISALQGALEANSNTADIDAGR
jgi:hypothetical protein